MKTNWNCLRFAGPPTRVMPRRIRIACRRVACAWVVCRRVACAWVVCRRVACACVVCRPVACACIVCRRVACACAVCRRADLLPVFAVHIAFQPKRLSIGHCACIRRCIMQEGCSTSGAPIWLAVDTEGTEGSNEHTRHNT